MLTRRAGDINPPTATPKFAFIGGVKFLRSKTGNLYRDGIVQAHRYVAHHATTQILTVHALF